MEVVRHEIHHVAKRIFRVRQTVEGSSVLLFFTVEGTDDIHQCLSLYQQWQAFRTRAENMELAGVVL